MFASLGLDLESEPQGVLQGDVDERGTYFRCLAGQGSHARKELNTEGQGQVMEPLQERERLSPSSEC